MNTGDLELSYSQQIMKMNRISRIINNQKLILGLNERYLDYIRPSNRRGAIKIADDKVLTKRVLKRKDIPVPGKIAVIKDLKALEKFNFDSLPKSFVVKPAHVS